MTVKLDRELCSGHTVNITPMPITINLKDIHCYAINRHFKTFHLSQTAGFKGYPFENIFDFTTAGDWDCVAAVERLPAIHYSVDFIFLSFGIMGFIV